MICRRLTSAPSMLDLLGGSTFSLDFPESESDWLPESEPLPESLLPDWLLLLEELELEPEPDPEPELDSSSELLHICKCTHTHTHTHTHSCVRITFMC